MKEVSNCETCVNFVYDDEDECYVCDRNLDEDDMVRFLTGTFDNCPYYQLDDEYQIVRHQMQDGLLFWTKLAIILEMMGVFTLKEIL